MRFIRRLLILVVGIVIGLGAYWGFKTMTIREPNDEVWVALNSRLPIQVRQWSCKQVNDRVGAKSKAPLGCEGLWK